MHINPHFSGKFVKNFQTAYNEILEEIKECDTCIISFIFFYIIFFILSNTSSNILSNTDLIKGTHIPVVARAEEQLYEQRNKLSERAIFFELKQLHVIIYYYFFKITFIKTYFAVL